MASSGTFILQDFNFRNTSHQLCTDFLTILNRQKVLLSTRIHANHHRGAQLRQHRGACI
jgi:hypothetical protein